MATAPDVKLAKKITRDYLECPLCLQLYDDPRALPCQHIICHRCLGLHINEQKKTDILIAQYVEPVLQCRLMELMVLVEAHT